MEKSGVAFDLLGDPIPEGFGKRGRPPHIPTQENRCKVMLLLATGKTDERIACALGITKPTLRKHYFRELRARDDARERVDASLMHKCWEQVEKGNVGAMKEFAKILERADMMALHPVAAVRDAARKAREPELGKKDAALEAARNPDINTPLGELIARRMGAGQTIQ